MKGWWDEGNFISKPSPIGWLSKFCKCIQSMVILLSRIFRRKDASTFLDKWFPIIDQVITSRSVLNWEKLYQPTLIVSSIRFRVNINVT
jgi:hypothetical protein